MNATERRLRDRVVRAAIELKTAYDNPALFDITHWLNILLKACAALAAHRKGKRK